MSESLYSPRKDSTICRADTKEVFEGAAKPQVEEACHNHGVAGNLDWYPNRKVTFHIPVKPVYCDDDPINAIKIEFYRFEPVWRATDRGELLLSFTLD